MGPKDKSRLDRRTLDEAVGWVLGVRGAAKGGAGAGCGDQDQGSGRDEAQRKRGRWDRPSPGAVQSCACGHSHASCLGHRPGLRAQPGGVTGRGTPEPCRPDATEELAQRSWMFRKPAVPTEPRSGI